MGNDASWQWGRITDWMLRCQSIGAGETLFHCGRIFFSHFLQAASVDGIEIQFISDCFTLFSLYTALSILLQQSEVFVRDSGRQLDMKLQYHAKMYFIVTYDRKEPSRRE